MEVQCGAGALGSGSGSQGDDRAAGGGGGSSGGAQEALAKADSLRDDPSSRDIAGRFDRIDSMQRVLRGEYDKSPSDLAETLITEGNRWGVFQRPFTAKGPKALQDAGVATWAEKYPKLSAQQKNGIARQIADGNAILPKNNSPRMKSHHTDLSKRVRRIETQRDRELLGSGRRTSSARQNRTTTSLGDLFE